MGFDVSCDYWLESFLTYNKTVFFSREIKSKFNSNPYHYKLKFSSTSKQKFNSKFQEFETVRILKYDQIWTKKHYLNQIITRKPIKKEGKISRIPALKRVLEEHRNFAQVVYNFFLCKWWWEIKTKEDKRKKKKEGVLEGCLFFSFCFIVGFSHDCFIWVMFFGPNLVLFYDSNGFEFLEF